MKYVYILQHSYECNLEGKIFEETKILGIYSSQEQAERAIKRYQDLPGFNKYTLDCFFIDKYQLDKDYWSEGFGFDE